MSEPVKRSGVRTRSMSVMSQYEPGSKVSVRVKFDFPCMGASHSRFVGFLSLAANAK
ncbi:unnamed protein product [Penicillium roqueforti FM164]|uniref:Genomic scaffold, ProqFM164S03 n=1 Tax=Penicillium roqueforti (strain FM164) TaxID=1365484 RepID=W6QF41_PENRF|nr:unnamed protein product [Penicillium roqueforti FM164]